MYISLRRGKQGGRRRVEIEPFRSVRMKKWWWWSNGWEYSEKFVGFKSDFRANFLILSSRREDLVTIAGGNFTEWKRHYGRLCFEYSEISDNSARWKMRCSIVRKTRLNVLLLFKRQFLSLFVPVSRKFGCFSHPLLFKYSWCPDIYTKLISIKEDRYLKSSPSPRYISLRNVEEEDDFIQKFDYSFSNML